MNPFIVAIVNSLVFRLFAILGGFLVSSSILTKEQFDALSQSAIVEVSGYVLMLLGAAYGFARTYIERRKLLKAQALPFPVSEKQLENRIAAGGAPSVFTPKNELPGPSTSPKPVWMRPG